MPEIGHVMPALSHVLSLFKERLAPHNEDKHKINYMHKYHYVNTFVNTNT